MLSVLDVPVKSNKYRVLNFYYRCEARNEKRFVCHGCIKGITITIAFYCPFLDYCIVFYLDIVSLNV